MPVVGVATWAIASSYRTTPQHAPGLLPAGSQPVQRAAAACHDVAKVQGFVASNADRDTVFDYLKVAEAELAIAAQAEPIWISLQSGVMSIDRGLRHDDAGASELGIAIARDQCRRAGIYLEGAVRPEVSPTG